MRVALVDLSQWIRSLGRVPPEVAFGLGKPLAPHTAPLDPEVQRYTSEWRVNPASGKKTMTALKHAAVLSSTPCLEKEAPILLDMHEARWL